MLKLIDLILNLILALPYIFIIVLFVIFVFRDSIDEILLFAKAIGFIFAWAFAIALIIDLIKWINIIRRKFSFISKKKAQDSISVKNKPVQLIEQADKKYHQYLSNVIPLIKSNSNWIYNFDSSKKEIAVYKEFYEKQLGRGKIWEIRHRIMLRGGSFNLCFSIYSKDYFHSITMKSDGIAVFIYVSKKNILNYGYENFRTELEANGFFRYAKNSPKLYDKWFVKTFVNDDNFPLYEVNQRNLEEIFIEENQRVSRILIKHLS